MSEYLTNLNAFKELIESYTIADLKSMIYEIEEKSSGGCCYPAVQTLFSLMELIGKLITPNITEEDAFVTTFIKLGDKYNDPVMAARLYNDFRHGIAHNSLAKGGVKVNKKPRAEDNNFHLSDDGQNLNVLILFEDFEPFFRDTFGKQLQQDNYIAEYAGRLRDVFSELNINWLKTTQQWGGLDISANYTRTDVPPSGTRLPLTPQSTAPTTKLKLKPPLETKGKMEEVIEKGSNYVQ
ncbi:hypothetical protein KJ632_05275 [Patescibacteria group bacterium]|nr:hypothetical protein [Patescibacteria group bacterium]